MASGEPSPCCPRGIVRGEMILADDPFRHVEGYVAHECIGDEALVLQLERRPAPSTRTHKRTAPTTKMTLAAPHAKAAS
jgi:hypothetical protein